MVTPNKKIRYDGDGTLCVWRDIDQTSSDYVDQVELGVLLLVLEAKHVKFEYPTKNWDLCLRVLTPKGAVGWIGSGWVKKVSPPSAK